MKKLFLFFCLIFASTPAFADFKATVSRTTLPEGESFQLYLRQNGDAEQPDVSVLNKDFTVVGQRKSYKTSIINGKAEKYNENILTLIPKTAGTVVLPAIYAGKEHTSPMNLTVVPAGTALPAAAGQKQPVQSKVFLRASLSDEKPFVAQQVVYTVRLYTNEDTVLLDGALTPPAADGVAVEQWGEARRSRTLINEAPYNVLEYKFLLFAQKSGKIKLEAPRFQGIVSDPDAGRDTDIFGFQSAFSGFFGQKNIVVRASDATLDVKPLPDGVKTGWLPATHVEIAEEFSPESASVALGEAVTRTVSVAVNGARDTQIPDPDFPAGDGYKLYPGQTDSKKMFDDQGIVGVKTRQVVFMPTKTGDVVLPALELPWYDVKNQTVQIAVLPSKTIKVTGTMPPERNQDVNAAAVPAEQAMPPAADVVPLAPPDKMPDYRLFFAGILVGAGVTGLAWLTVGRIMIVRVRKAEERQAALPRRAAESALKQACAANDAVAARIALLEIAALYWEDNPPLTLSGVADRFRDAALAGQIDALNTVLYAPASVEWNGAGLWKAFKKTKLYRKTAEKSGASPVPPLYPT
ncbi:MAG TPA: hypothetical protein DD624_03405 [Alphaproteobacteria bacterium]|nr:hypothetical protein [Alphaproteobacteria bacterium]